MSSRPFYGLALRTPVYAWATMVNQNVWLYPIMDRLAKIEIDVHHQAGIIVPTFRRSIRGSA